MLCFSAISQRHIGSCPVVYGVPWAIPTATGITISTDMIHCYRRLIALHHRRCPLVTPQCGVAAPCIRGKSHPMRSSAHTRLNRRTYVPRYVRARMLRAVSILREPLSLSFETSRPRSSINPDSLQLLLFLLFLFLFLFPFLSSHAHVCTYVASRFVETRFRSSRDTGYTEGCINVLDNCYVKGRERRWPTRVNCYQLVSRGTGKKCRRL